MGLPGAGRDWGGCGWLIQRGNMGVPRIYLGWAAGLTQLVLSESLIVAVGAMILILAVCPPGCPLEAHTLQVPVLALLKGKSRLLGSFLQSHIALDFLCLFLLHIFALLSP